MASARSLFLVLLAGCLSLVFGAAAHAAVTHLGNPYTPAGASFSIIALQGIDSLTPTGKSGFSPQVNANFEFQGSTGVSYDQGGHLVDFGIGLYKNAQNITQSTGLEILYNQLVYASSVTITVEDFDLTTTSTFFNPLKVEPSVRLIGANGTVIASASPANIWSALTLQPKGPKGTPDVWSLSFAQLCINLSLQNAIISGFILYADQTSGETANSDPYLLVSAGNGTLAVPEPETYAMLLAGLGLLGFAARHRKQKTA